MVNIVLQPEHGYMVLLTVGGVMVNMWAAFKVKSARSLYNVQYPKMYADKDDKHCDRFNCVQRAHQNLLENLPIYFALLATSSIFRPQVAAIAGLVRLTGFVFYVQGYSSGDPQKRMRGMFGILGMFAGIGLSIEAGIRLLL